MFKATRAIRIKRKEFVHPEVHKVLLQTFYPFQTTNQQGQKPKLRIGLKGTDYPVVGTTNPSLTG